MNPGWDSVNVPPMYLGCRKRLETRGLETQTLGFSREVYSKHLVLEVGLSKRFGTMYVYTLRVSLPTRRTPRWYDRGF